MIENSIANKERKQEFNLHSHNSLIINNEDVETYYRRVHSRYFLGLLIVTFLSAFSFLYIVAANQNLYFTQNSKCKSVYFGGFYFYFLTTFFLVSLYLRNLRIDVFNQKESILVLHSFKQTLFLFTSQLVFAGFFFIADNFFCSANMTNTLIEQLTFQTTQFTLVFIIGFFYSTKVNRQIEEVTQLKTEKAKNQCIELFNASFALNETKSEADIDFERNRVADLKTLDVGGKGNSSQFTVSCDNNKFVSVLSLDGMMNVNKLKKIKRSPRKRLSAKKNSAV